MILGLDMVLFRMKCIFCNHKKLYVLKTGQLKCGGCKKKFSQKKILQRERIIECFCKNLTANQTAQILKISYQTIANEYKKIRENIAIFSQEYYIDKEILAYDEYLYLEKSKKQKENIFQSKNFLTFCYENKVYNLLMPNIKRYEELEVKDFSRFMRTNKISKYEEKELLIRQFWDFFESSILKYKGVDEENFFYYLKECEFKFNYTYERQNEILKSFS